MSSVELVLVTNPTRPNDGFGENFKFSIYSVMYAEFHKLTFVYTPFQDMEHNYNNDPNFLSDKETLINFIFNYSTTTKRPPSSYRVLNPFELLKFYQSNIDWCSKSNSMITIKHLFRINKPSPFLQYNNTNTNTNTNTIIPTINVAIHIRRMNDHDYNRAPEAKAKGKAVMLAGMDVPNEFYLNVIEQFNNRLEYKNSNVIFHIYSQGIQSEFEEVFTNIKNKIILHINEKLEDTFTQLVFADVLVMAPSALSYTAGLLSNSNNEVYYINFCNPPLPSWSVIQGYQSSRMKHEFIASIPTPVYYDPNTDTFQKINP
jgi:hypothetical protein